VPTSLPRSVSVAANSGSNYDVATRKNRSLWVWWHLLSLDAPTVAVVWCWFFGYMFGLNFTWTTLPTLALGTWCVYVADRLLDGWRSTETVTLRDRHWFYLRHRRPFLIAWTAAAAPLAYLIFFRAQPRVRTDDVILCLIGVAYFLLIHGRSSPRSGAHLFPSWLPEFPNWLSKELVVGFLFAIATAVPTWARLTLAWAPLTSNRSLLIAAVFTFGAACWLNCVAIQTWEDAEASHEVVHTILSARSHHGLTPGPRGLTEFLGEHLTAFAIAVGAVSLGLAAAAARSHLYPLFTSIALSALVFLGLIRYSHRFSALFLRIAADAALLTPLIFLLRVR